MKTLRTPDERFDNLPGYSFEPNYIEVSDFDGGSLRIHYIDEGPKEAEPILMLHGEPSWSYLYRKMVPVLVKAGYRAIAPDLAGFGRSDKPVNKEDYTYQRHTGWMEAVITALDLKDIKLMCQDWGGLIGLRLVAGQPERFSHVIASNTAFPLGEPFESEMFEAWIKFSQEVPELPVGEIINGATNTPLSDDIVAAYDAPFPDESYKIGARMFPLLVPVSKDDPAVPDNLKAWDILGKLDIPFLTAFSDSDPVTAGMDTVLKNHIPGTKGQPHTIIKDAGHFVQEDKGEELARVIVAFIT